MKIKNRSLFAVLAGQYKGNFVIVVEKNEKKEYISLALPSFEIYKISEKDMFLAIKEGVIVFVKKLPLKYFNSCLKEYEYRQQGLVSNYNEYNEEKNEILNS